MTAADSVVLMMGSEASYASCSTCTGRFLSRFLLRRLGRLSRIFTQRLFSASLSASTSSDTADSCEISWDDVTWTEEQSEGCQG